MTMHPETEVSPELADLFAAPAMGMHSPEMEAQVMRRIVRLRRLRAILPGVGAIVGIAVAIPGLVAAPFPRLATGELFANAPWNPMVEFIFDALGKGGFGSIAVAGVLTVLGLAFARFLEEV